MMLDTLVLPVTSLSSILNVTIKNTLVGVSQTPSVFPTPLSLIITVLSQLDTNTYADCNTLETPKFL